MIGDELYVNGQIVDMSSATRIGTTYQANNIGEIQNRQGDFSNQFRLPKTQRNRTVFENMDYVSSATTIPYRVNVARYVQDGIDTVREGIVTAVSSNEDFYIVQVNSGNTNFFSLFPDVQISDLNIPNLSLPNTFTTVLASRTNTSGIIYPLIDWFTVENEVAFTDLSPDGTGSAGNPGGAVNTEYLLPCLFVKDLFTAVDNLTGYVSKGSLIDSSVFQNLVITPRRLGRSDASKTKYNQQAYNDLNQTYVNTEQILGYSNFGYGFIPPSPGGQSIAYKADQNGLFGYFSFRGAASYTNNTAGLLIVTLVFQIIKFDGATFTVVEAQGIGRAIQPGLTASYYFDVVTENIVFSASDMYYTRVIRSGATVGSQLVIDKATRWTFNLVENLPYGSTINAAELYEVDVKKVYQDVMNKFGVLVQTNSFRREVYFNFFEDIQANTAKARIWTNLVDPNRISVNYKFGKYAQKNLLVHEEADDVTPGQGDSSFAIDDQTLPDILTVVSMNTSAADEEIRYQGEAFPRIKALTYGNRSMSDSNYRLLVLEKKNTPYTVRYYDDDGATADVSNSIPFARFSPLSFVNILPKYYPTLQGILRKTKGVQVYINLSPKDIQELDYLIPVYLDVHSSEVDLSGYFYLNKIQNYQRGYTLCELMRL